MPVENQHPPDPHVDHTLASPAQTPRSAVILCIATTVVVASVEIGLGWSFGLLSLMAEGLHTTADLVDSLIAFVLITLAMRPPDKHFPFGYGKFDSFAGAVEGSFVVLSGLWAGFVAVRSLLGYDHFDPHPNGVVLAAMAASAVLYWFVSAYVLRVAARTGSPTAKAEGVHLRTHVYITAGLFVGLGISAFAAQFGYKIAHWVDPLMALALGALLIWIGGKLIFEAGQHLSDTAIPAEEQQQLTAMINDFRDEFVEVHALRTRRAGMERHIDIHLVVPAATSVEAGHTLAHRIEQRIQKSWPEAKVLVHVEPPHDATLERFEERGRVGGVVPQETR